MVDIDQETGQKIQDLQILEQNFQNISMQRQAFQIELNETSTALEEVGKAKGDVFRVLGQVMVKSDKSELKKELKEKKDLLELRIKAIEKQDLSLRENIERLRGEIVNKIHG
ncbi:prefoldin subunit beta [Candidatus Pacearchaeota archaeon]|nr:prefoldin subunit beta [Candidatus Pacearchaeota archaeon]